MDTYECDKYICSNENDEIRKTHWPCKIKLFPKTPRTFGRDLPELKMISKPVLTDIGLRLAGF